MKTFIIDYTTPTGRPSQHCVTAEDKTDASDQFVHETGNDFGCIVGIKEQIRAQYHVDNQPSYYTSNTPDYQSLEFNIIASTTPERLFPDAAEDPIKQIFLVEPVRVSGAVDVRDVKRLLGRALTPTPCTCEHDCCGHRHGYAQVRMFDFDRAEVTVTTNRNY